MKYLGGRKFILGVLYLIGCFWIGDRAVANSLDLTAVGVFCAGVATGVGAVVWGNIKAKQTIGQKPKGTI